MLAMRTLLHESEVTHGRDAHVHEQLQPTAAPESAMYGMTLYLPVRSCHVCNRRRDRLGAVFLWSSASERPQARIQPA